MKIKFLIYLVLTIIFPQIASSQLKSGLLIGTGNGKMDIEYRDITFKSNSNVSYKSNYLIGYRFRIPLTTPSMFIDLDANIGFKKWSSRYGKPDTMKGYQYSQNLIYGAESSYYFTSISGVANYKIYKGLSVGIGAEPTYYFRKGGEKSYKDIDIPIIARLAYNLKFLEIGVSYKYSIMKSIETDYLKSGKFRELQLSIWIPF